LVTKHFESSMPFYLKRYIKYNDGGFGWL
jgi:hypothetical protein